MRTVTFRKSIISTLVITCMAMMGLHSCDNNSESADQKQTINRQADSLELLQEQNMLLRRQADSLESALSKWFTDEEIDFFNEKGISNPETDLINDLMSRSGLIPYKAVLGGTMRIWDASLLGNKWAIAYFEDGHISGRMLLKFKVSGNQKIQWQVMDAYLD